MERSMKNEKAELRDGGERLQHNSAASGSLDGRKRMKSSLSLVSSKDSRDTSRVPLRLFRHLAFSPELSL
jgi:hypothetical protein